MHDAGAEQGPGSRVEDFDYTLPAELIAQTPVEPRDAARLLAVPRAGPLRDCHVRDLPDLLRPGDLLVVNDTRVIPARLHGEREAGGKVELLLLRRLDAGVWEALGKPGRRLRAGTALRFGGVAGRVVERGAGGSLVVRFMADGDVDAAVLAAGEVPLPPYIHGYHGDPERYQTTYATREGSVAAPTAGLHFTAELFERLAERGIARATVTLHVGVGTFRPMTAPTIAGHRMHAEWCEVSPETAATINATRAAGGRVVAVGTTSVRTLEGAAAAGPSGALEPFRGWTDLFIAPGFRFRVVDALLTNFHLPRSSLLVLVSALLGLERTRAVYAHAVERRYRFYSFGDAMLIL